MTKAIIIAVSDGFGGYGDFLFALKLSQQLRNYHSKKGHEPPPIYIVTQDTGKEKIINLGGNVEFDVEILTPQDLTAKIEADEIEVQHLIEAPVFSSDLIDRIDESFATLTQPIPLTMVPEYGYCAKKENMEARQLYRKTKLNNIAYANTIYTGFNRAEGEKGILLSEDLIGVLDENAMLPQLEERMRNRIFNALSVQEYQQQNELSFQYSHDTYKTTREDTSAEHYLKIQRIFADKSRNQDVIMVGKVMTKKYQALENILEKLTQDGYARIIFYDADGGTEFCLHDSLEEGTTYRVIYTAKLTHQSMIACMALSGPIVGATGDQSFSEAVSANKLIVYECLAHKILLLESYDKMLNDRIDTIEPNMVIDIMRRADPNDEEDYELLGELGSAEILAKISKANKSVLQEMDLISTIADGLLWVEQWIHIASLIELDQDTEALDAFNHPESKVAISDEYQGVSLWQIAETKHPDGLFARHFNPIGMPHFILKLYLESKQEEKADVYISMHQISPLALIGDEMILKKILNLKLYDLFAKMMQRMTAEAEKHTLIGIINETNPNGVRYLIQIRQDCQADHPARAQATVMVAMSKIAQYHPKTGTQRQIMFDSFQELAKLFVALSSYNEPAFIGLLLLNKENIAAKYKYLTPSGTFFGSGFHKMLEGVFSDLDVDLSQMTRADKIEYYRALVDVINNQPNFLGNEYILNSLSRLARVQLPIIFRIPPIIAKQMLSTHQAVSDHSILQVSQGFYQLNLNYIGKGGWGCVYAASHYFLQGDQLIVRESLALKRVSIHNGQLLLNECQLIKRVYPDGYFDVFDHGDYSYLAMPLFPGVPLDKYLSSITVLSLNERLKMAKALLLDLNKIHQQGITHNDLKTKNILFNSSNSEMHIIDFGCAQRFNHPMKYHDIDTAVFAFEIPPEYLVGADSASSLDVFAVAPILAELVGMDKRRLTSLRMSKALIQMKGISHLEDLEDFEADIWHAFINAETIEEALFDPILSQYRESVVLESFIETYVKLPYDFKMYSAEYSADLIQTLNQMQAPNPAERPSLQYSIAVLDREIVEVPNPTSTMRASLMEIKSFGEGPSNDPEANKEDSDSNSVDPTLN